MQAQLKKQVEQATSIKSIENMIDQYAVEKDLKMSQRNQLYSEAVAHYKSSRQFFAPSKRVSEKNGKTYISIHRGTIKSDGSKEVKQNRWNEVLNCEETELKQIYDTLTQYLKQ